MTGFILSFLTAQMSAVLRKQSFGPLVLINKTKTTTKLLNEPCTSTADNSSLCLTVVEQPARKTAHLQLPQSIMSFPAPLLFPAPPPHHAVPLCIPFTFPTQHLGKDRKLFSIDHDSSALNLWPQPGINLCCSPQLLSKASPSQTLFAHAPCSCLCAPPHSTHWLPSPAAVGLKGSIRCCLQLILILSLVLPLQARVGQPSCGTECIQLSLTHSLPSASCDRSQMDRCTHTVIFISLNSLQFPYSMRSSRRKHLLCLYFRIIASSADLETQTQQQWTFVGEAERGSKLRVKWLRAAEVFKQDENTESSENKKQWEN